MSEMRQSVYGTASLIVAVVVIVCCQQLVAYQVNRETLVNRSIGREMTVKVDETYDISKHNRVLIDDMYERTTDRWTKTDHDRWSAEFARLNPGIKLPVLSEPRPERDRPDREPVPGQPKR